MAQTDQAQGTAEESAVVSAVRIGGADAFSSLTEPYRRELRAHCYRMLGNLEDAEDLVQETLLRAWRARSGFEGRSSLRAWLYRIATNVCLDAIKRMRRRVRVVDAPSGSGPAPSFDEVPWLQPLPDALLGGEVSVGVSALRPPGHHAEVARAMGFCFFGNVAVAARRATSAHGVSRVLIVDWDVHHGNGTNDIFHADADVLFVSLHEYPLYPGTGPASDVGSGAGEGFTVNLGGHLIEDPGSGLTKVFSHVGKELVHGEVSEDMPIWDNEKGWTSVRDRYTVRVPDPRVDFRVAAAVAVAMDALMSR